MLQQSPPKALVEARHHPRDFSLLTAMDTSTLVIAKPPGRIINPINRLNHSSTEPLAKALHEFTDSNAKTKNPMPKPIVPARPFPTLEIPTIRPVRAPQVPKRIIATIVTICAHSFSFGIIGPGYAGSRPIREYRKVNAPKSTP